MSTLVSKIQSQTTFKHQTLLAYYQHEKQNIPDSVFLKEQQDPLGFDTRDYLSAVE